MLQETPTRRISQLPTSDAKGGRLLRRSKSLGVKIRRNSNGNADKFSITLRDQPTLSNQNICKSNNPKEFWPKKQKRQKTELPALSEKPKRLSKEEVRQLELDKMAVKWQQRREIYALNREMRKLENEAFHAFMSRCGNELRDQVVTGGCKPLDGMILAGARV